MGLWKHRLLLVILILCLGFILGLNHRTKVTVVMPEDVQVEDEESGCKSWEILCTALNRKNYGYHERYFTYVNS